MYPVIPVKDNSVERIRVLTKSLQELNHRLRICVQHTETTLFKTQHKNLP